MAANDYYTLHPQNQAPSPQPFQSANTSCKNYLRPTSSNIPYSSSLPDSTSLSDISNSSPPSDTDRGFLTPSSKEPGLKKSKSERALKFVGKQVKKQIEKKLNHGSGQHGQEDALNQAFGQEQGGGAGGDYGYGTSSGDYGYGDTHGAGDVSGIGGGGGEYGYGDSSTGYGPVGDMFGDMSGGGNFEWAGSGGDGGFWDSLDLSGFEG